MCAFDFWLKKLAEWENQRDSWLSQRSFAEQEEERINWPSKPREIIRREPDGEYSVSMAHWGLVPYFVKESEFKKATVKAYNARCETVSSNGHFRYAYQSKRCLLVSNGYGEWADKIEDRKQSVKFVVDGGKPIAYAGLWETWGPRESPYVSCTMITCEPNELAAEVHTRMPVILHEEDYEAWLDPESNPKELLALLMPFPAERMSYEEVTLPPRQKKVQQALL